MAEATRAAEETTIHVGDTGLTINLPAGYAKNANFGAYPLNTLDVFLVTHNLHTRPEMYGFMDTAFGVGAVVGAICAGRVAQRLGLSRTFWVGLLGAGLMTLVYSRLSTFAAGLVTLLFLAAPLAAMNAVVAPIVMRSVPRRTLGRVFAILQPAIQVMSVIAIAVAGWLSSSVLRNLHADIAGVELGTYDTIFGAAGLLITAGGLYAMIALRGSDTERQPAAEPATITS